MSGRGRVLLVEDNPATCRLVRYVLIDEPLDLREASLASAALELAEADPPDVILQDLQLPDLDGFELVRKFRAIPALRDVPILAFSGFLSQLDEQRIGGAGFTDLITKPIEPAQLLRIVREYLPGGDRQPTQRDDRRRVLLADDDPVQRKLTAFRLSRLGYDVSSVADGASALQAARASTPSAVVSDVQMPGMDGFALTAAIREDPRLRHLPVVLLTSTFVDDADRDFSGRIGADAFLVRTPDMSELAHTLERVLDAPSAGRSRAIADAGEFARERAELALIQLERQVALRAGITQHCAVLSAELAVLSTISQAIVNHASVESVLREALAACFDAGGVSVGALYLLAPGDAFQVYRVGSYAEWGEEQLNNFFGEPDLLREIIARRHVTTIVAPDARDAPTARFLANSGLRSALIVPLVDRVGPTGALAMLSKRVDLSLDERERFAQAVGNQISVALSLARSFEEQAASERAARAQTALLESVFASMSDAVVVAEGGRIATWNASASSLLGLTEEQRGKLIEGASNGAGFLRHDKTTPLPLAEGPLVRASRGEFVEGAEVFLRNASRPEGAWLTATARPLKDERGDVRGAVSVFRDVTAERLAREQLVVSERMASVGMLAASVGHEINNPLSSVVGNLDLAGEAVSALRASHPHIDLGDLTDEIREAREGAARVRAIVMDLKIFSRGDDEVAGPVDPEAVLESAVRMAWNEVRHRATIVRRFGRVPNILATEARLAQVFLNLLINAAQAIGAGHADKNEIRLSTRVEGGTRVVVDIEDTGSGIPPEVLSRLFSPFVTTKPVGVGTGLGLTICRRLVTAMGGDISVDTEVGVGTTFHLTFEIADAPARAVPVPAPAPRPAGRRGRVLVVDDEVAVGSLIDRALRGAHDVTVTTSAPDALASIVAGARFDMILCDLMMPVMTGSQFYGELCNVAPDQAQNVFFLTGGAFTPQTRAFLESTGNRKIEKPFAIATLLQIVSAQVSQSKGFQSV
jgi:CheY-like chemotaxis protein